MADCGGDNSEIKPGAIRGTEVIRAEGGRGGYTVYTIHTVGCGRVEWCSNFCDFRNGHYASDQVYFYEANSKKSASLAAHFQKITGTLQTIFFLKIRVYRPITSKNNPQKNSKLTNLKNYLEPPKGANSFLTWSKKTNSFWLSVKGTVSREFRHFLNKKNSTGPPYGHFGQGKSVSRNISCSRRYSRKTRVLVGNNYADT